MEFKEYFLKDICYFQEGYVNPKQTISDYFDGEVKWLRANDLQNNYVYNTSRTLTKAGFESAGKSAKLFKPNTIAISKSGTIGRLGILKDYMCGNRAVINIECNNDIIDIKYLYYFLLFNRPYIESLAQGSVQKNLYVFILEKVKIKLPNKDIQKKIVKILNDIDNKIELNNKINDNLLEIMETYFNNWIENLSIYEKSNLNEIANYTNGLAMQKFRPKDNESSLPVIKIKEMNSGISSDTERCSCNIKDDVKIDNGDILFAWSGTLCMCIWGKGKAGLNQHIFKVTSEKYPKWFYYLWTKKHLDRFIQIAQGKATTMGHIKREELSMSEVLIPTNSELEKMNNLMRPLLSKYINILVENEYLQELRVRLLPKLMNGEIELDKIELEIMDGKK